MHVTNIPILKIGEIKLPKMLLLVAQLCLTLHDPMDCIACQVPLSMEFSRQEYWSGLPLPSPGDLPNPGIEPGSPALHAYSLPSEPPGTPKSYLRSLDKLLKMGSVLRRQKKIRKKSKYYANAVLRTIERSS